MNEKLTEIVFILDESGSMSSLRDDTIGGFNSMLEKQREEEGLCYVSLVTFNDNSKVILDRVPISEVKNLTNKDYCPMGCTALIDALGASINHIGNIHKYAREEDRPKKTLFVITTDGMENASRHYSADRVRQMVSRQQEKYGWEFIFLGANIDAVETAARYGIRRENAVNYVNDKAGTQKNYMAMNAAIHEMRCMPYKIKLSAAWREGVDQDYANRGKENN